MESYKIVGRIGEGAHGLVLRARHTENGRDVALKKIQIKKLDGGIPRNIVREIKVLQHIDDDYVVRLLDVFPQGMSCVLVFEFMPSGLWEVIHDPDIELFDAQIKSYMFMLLKGVAYLHNNNIMHRDLKPSNLVIDRNGVLKIADLGLGRLFSQDSKKPYSHQVATRWYRAPELLYGARYYDPGVDMWAVGCIFAEMLNKSPLFPGETDIEQLVIVLRTLGTPTEEMWPNMHSLPDFNKIAFPPSVATPYEDLVPDACEDSVNLLKNLLLYDSSKRLAASEALLHTYFFNKPSMSHLEDMPKPGEDHRKKFAPRANYETDFFMQDLFEDLTVLITNA